MATPAPGASKTSCSMTCAVLADELDGQLALAGEAEIGGAVLVAESVTADDDGLGPAGHQPRHVPADDRLAEDDAAEDVADGAVRRLPHLLEVEFLHPRLVRGDRGAFDPDAVLLGRLGRVDGHLVVGHVAVLDAEVVVEQVDIEIGADQLVLDQLPDDAGHLIAVHFDDGVGNLDFGHGRGTFGRDGEAGEVGRLLSAVAAPAKTVALILSAMNQRAAGMPFGMATGQA